MAELTQVSSAVSEGGPTPTAELTEASLAESKVNSTTTAELIEAFASLPYPNSKNHTAETFSSPLVELLVGPQEIAFTVHKDILTQSEYFAKCLDGERFQEGVTNCVKLPEDDPTAFAWIIQFLYTDHVFARSNFRLGGWDGINPQRLSGLISFYAIADKYCIEKICERIVHHVSYELYVEQLGWCHFDQLKAAGLQSSRLWDQLMDNMVKGCKFRSPTTCLLRMLDDGLRSDMKTAMELLEKMAVNANDEVARQSAPDNGWGN